MGQIASKAQLRMSLLRWVLVTVPLILFVGILIARLSGSGFGNRWFDALLKPTWFPPGWLFGAAWTFLYILLGVAAAMILNARGASGRNVALGLFAGQLLLNFAWSPLFFAAHRVTLALGLVLLIFALASAATVAFARIRKAAGWLMLPYLAWLAFAAVLNWQIDQLNPDAETLKTRTPAAHIVL